MTSELSGHGDHRHTSPRPPDLRVRECIKWEKRCASNNDLNYNDKNLSHGSVAMAACSV